MTVYITQGRYTQRSVAALVHKPEDRAIAVAGLAKAVGGKLLDYFVTFGEYDFLVLIESGKGRKETDVMAALMAAAATGGVSDLKTTIAVRSKDSMKSMRAAKKILKDFRAAGEGN